MDAYIKFIKALISHLEEIEKDAVMGYTSCEVFCECVLNRKLRFKGLNYILCYLLAIRNCIRIKFCNHQFDDYGTAGPESGDIYLICKKCGYSYYHVLY